eukprot:GDKK01025123.1.p1 GENE.GDKK01025123.1~~GDKK01025123.1.p1  ORF type:complete len:258 (+),score=30.37 GDKK01025123.1:37-810(+)
MLFLNCLVFFCILEIAFSSVCMVLLAGGVGSRMKADIPKQFLPLGNQRVIDYSIDLFFSEISISHITIVVDPSFYSLFQERIWLSHQSDSRTHKLQVMFANPGAERFYSVSNGISRLPDSCEIIGIHDSARPLLHPHDLKAVITNGSNKKSALLVKRIAATIKKGDNNIVTQSVSREGLFEALTPQVFDSKLLRYSYDVAKNEIEKGNLSVEGLTDDEEVVRMFAGVAGALVESKHPNFKITTPDDLVLAEALIKSR